MPQLRPLPVADELLDGHMSLLGNGGNVLQVRERLHRGGDRVSLAGAADRLAQDVANAGRLYDGTYRPARDDTRARRCRPQQHHRRAILAHNWVRNSPTHKGHLDEMLFGIVHSFPNSVGDLVCFAAPGTDDPVLVADDDDGAVVESPAAAHDLRYSIDLDHSFLEGQLVRVDFRHGAFPR